MAQKGKLKLDMTTKRPSRKQIIVLMGSNNVERTMAKAKITIVNINRLLKDIKSKVSIWTDSKGLLLTTNKVAATSDLNIVKKYLKELNNIDNSEIISSKLPQLKSYLKILEIPYFTKDSNLFITSDSIEHIIKLTHIFNNIILVSCLYIIKVSLKLDIAVIWIDIWDSQSGFNTKILIKRCFNIGSHITTIHSTNMNTGVLQCKNCWKWEHTTFAC